MVTAVCTVLYSSVASQLVIGESPKFRPLQIGKIAKKGGAWIFGENQFPQLADRQYLIGEPLVQMDRCVKGQ